VDENVLEITQAQARDADVPAEALVWRLADGADAALFTLDADTGVLRWRTAPDHEQPLDADGDGVYVLTLQVRDGLHTASQSLAVVVRDVDEAPRLDKASLTLAEGGSGVPVLRSWDADTPATALVYTVQVLTGGQFEHVRAPGVAVTRFTQAEVDAADLRFVADGGEAAPVVRLVLSDGRTALEPAALQVVFTPVNDAPESADVSLAAMDEDAPLVLTADELLAGIRDADGDVLAVTALRLVAGEGTLTGLGGGRWRFDPAADWHGTATFAAEVGDGQATTTLMARLPVRAVNDAPRWLDPDGTPGAAVRTIELAENTVAVTTVAVADPDGATVLRYAVAGGADAALFQIDAATGALSLRVQPDSEQPADADQDGRYEVTVEVSDGELTVQQALQIQVTNVDEAPLVRRNVLLLTDDTVTLVLQASDPDTPATALVYRVETVEGGQFERASAPGMAVQVFTQAELDAAEVVWVASAGRASALFALRLSDGQSDILVSSPAVERQQERLAPSPTALRSDVSVENEGQDKETATDRAALATVTANKTTAAELAPSAPLTADDGGLGLGRTDDGTGADAGRVQVSDAVAVAVRSVATRAAAAVQAEIPHLVLDLDLLSDTTQAQRSLVGDQYPWSSRSGASLVEQMDRLRQEVAEARQTGVLSLASTALVSTGLSVGYVVWLVRGGVLMTSLMSAVPAWAGMDPLPVLAEMGRGDGDGGDDDTPDDPIEKLFSKARRLLVRPELPLQPSVGGPEIPPCA
jgi:Cadherin-like domain/Cadherin-like